MAHDADHLAGRHLEADVVEHQPAAVAERHAIELDLAAHVADRDRILGIEHARHAVEDLEQALRGRRRALGGGEHAAHALDPRVEAADVRDERGEHADGDLVVQDLARADRPHHQQPDLIEQRDRRPEERPHGVVAVVDLDDALVGLGEARDLAPLLREGLDHANARDGVGQDVGHGRPHAPAAQVAVRQLAANTHDEPRDGREGNDGRDGKQRIEREQDDAGADDHQHVGDEIDQRVGEERAQVLGIRADARDQIAGALAAEVLEAELLQMREGTVAQIRRHLLGHEGQHRPLRPSQQPRDDGCTAQAAEVEQDLGQRGLHGRAVRPGPAPAPGRRAAWSGRAESGPPPCSPG